LLQLLEKQVDLLYYDKPLLYLTKTVDNQLVIGSYLSETELFEEYIHVINDELIPLYLSGKITLLDLFKAESSVLYLSWKEETFYYHKLIQFSDIPSDELPMDISYLLQDFSYLTQEELLNTYKENELSKN